MESKHHYIAVQQLRDVHKVMGPELYLAFDILNTSLTYNHPPVPGNTPRQRAELREARRILLQLKHPDDAAALPKDEVAWALHTVIAAGESLGLKAVLTAMRRAALLLAIDVGAVEGIPGDLDKKIGNAVKVLLHGVSIPQTLATAS